MSIVFIPSKTNLVINFNNKWILKIFLNKYFKQQGRYEFLVYNLLKKYRYRHVPTQTLFKEIVFKHRKIQTIIMRYLGSSLKEKSNISFGVLRKVVLLIKSLHRMQFGDDDVHFISMHPQNKLKNPLNFLRKSIISKIKRKFKYQLPSKYVNLNTHSNQKNFVFSHRDPNFKHIIETPSNNLLLIDFEDSGFFPEEVDYASFLKDLIEFTRDEKAIRFFLKLIKIKFEEIFPYLKRLYLIDYAFNHNPTLTPFKVFKQLLKQNTFYLNEFLNKIKCD